MVKAITLNPVEYQMLLEIAKKNRQKPNEILGSLIQNAYDSCK
jgi:hypothetical protein